MCAETYTTAVAVIVIGVVAALGVYWIFFRSRNKLPEDEQIITHEQLQDMVRALVREVETMIALRSLTRAFSEDPRIGPTYDNTYEAHGFVSCRSTVESGLVLCIMRYHNHRSDSHGLTAFFNALKDEATSANLRKGILQRRREWVDEEESQQDTEEHMAQVEEARKRHGTLKGTNQFDRVRNYRHTKIAHGALAAETKRAQPVERDYLYFLTDQTREIVQSLSGAVLGEGQGFTEWGEIWDGNYTPAFFDTLMERVGE